MKKTFSSLIIGYLFFLTIAPFAFASDNLYPKYYINKNLDSLNECAPEFSKITPEKNIATAYIDGISFQVSSDLNPEMIFIRVGNEYLTPFYQKQSNGDYFVFSPYKKNLQSITSIMVGGVSEQNCPRQIWYTVFYDKNGSYKNNLPGSVPNTQEDVIEDQNKKKYSQPFFPTLDENEKDPLSQKELNIDQNIIPKQTDPNTPVYLDKVFDQSIENDQIVRGEAIRTIVKKLYVGSDKVEESFDDIDETSKYFGAVAIATPAGVIEPKKSFNSEHPITRAEAIKVMIKSVEKSSRVPAVNSPTIINKIDHWFFSFHSKAYAFKVVSQIETIDDLNRPITKKEFDDYLQIFIDAQKEYVY